jgi:hypothetical protein
MDQLLTWGRNKLMLGEISVSTVMNMNMADFWDVVSCSLVGIDISLRGLTATIIRVMEAVSDG